MLSLLPKKKVFKKMSFFSAICLKFLENSLMFLKGLHSNHSDDHSWYLISVENQIQGWSEEKVGGQIGAINFQMVGTISASMSIS